MQERAIIENGSHDNTSSIDDPDYEAIMEEIRVLENSKNRI